MKRYPAAKEVGRTAYPPQPGPSAAHRLPIGLIPRTPCMRISLWCNLNRLCCLRKTTTQAQATLPRQVREETIRSLFQVSSTGSLPRGACAPSSGQSLPGAPSHHPEAFPYPSFSTRYPCEGSHCWTLSAARARSRITCHSLSATSLSTRGHSRIRDPEASSPGTS